MGALGTQYGDIIGHSLEKVKLYMGHAVRCAAQQRQIQELQAAAGGGVAVVTIDYMMKYEESRAREASREHYGKRGLVVHGAMVTYKKGDGSIAKRICITVPEGDGTQDAPSALAMLDVICLKVIKEDPDFEGVSAIIILSDNAGTYSADFFSVAAFDVAKSHGLSVAGIIHNEAQDGKTELDSWFFHFKRQLKKWMSRFKCAVLTPRHMAEAMEYSTGVKGMRLDIVRLDRNHLDRLFDDKGQFYGALKDRMKQALPSNLAEVRTADDGSHQLYESSALPPFAFNNGTVKKVDNYMTEKKDNNTGRKNPLVMGYGFFKDMYNCLKLAAVPALGDLPDASGGGLMTKTEVLMCVPPPDRPGRQAVADDVVDDDDIQSSSDEADEAAGEAGDRRVVCSECGRSFASEAFLGLHSGKKTCRKLTSNNTVEARSVRAMRRLIDGGEVVVHDRDADISHVAPAAAAAVDDVCDRLFPRGWAARPKHGHSKGHLYMTDDHKEKIRDYFDAGELDSGRKKSPALMAEALSAAAEVDDKHRTPFVSEITPYISQLVLARKKGADPAAVGTKGRVQTTVPERFHEQLVKLLEASRSENKTMPKNGVNSLLDQLKLQHQDSVPGDFPSRAAVCRFQVDWQEKQGEGQQQGQQDGQQQQEQQQAGNDMEVVVEPQQEQQQEDQGTNNDATTTTTA